MVRQASKRLSESIDTSAIKGYRDESDTDNGYAYNPGRGFAAAGFRFSCEVGADEGAAHSSAVNSELTRSLARAVVKLGTRVATLEDKVCRRCGPSPHDPSQLEDALREIAKLSQVAQAFVGWEPANAR